MFDIFSKLGEIKEKANQLQSKVAAQSFSTTDSAQMVSITTNGKKDIVSISLSKEFDNLSLAEKERILLQTIKLSLHQSESFIVNELKEIIPPIPGMNIFG
jgi:DNA-binding protein YbaB